MEGQTQAAIVLVPMLGVGIQVTDQRADEGFLPKSERRRASCEVAAVLHMGRRRTPRNAGAW